jgi:hypothetical protein
MKDSLLGSHDSLNEADDLPEDVALCAAELWSRHASLALRAGSAESSCILLFLVFYHGLRLHLPGGDGLVIG